MKDVFVICLVLVIISVEMSPAIAAGEVRTCITRSRCFLKRIACPDQCPSITPKNPNSKACFIDCNSPKCEAVCRNRKPNCNGKGTGCFDPRFIGGDGIVFYFHGRRNDHFALLSDANLQINARFIGLRPAGRPRDFTWIQGLGILFHRQKSLTIEATTASRWDSTVDHFRFAYNGDNILLPDGHLSRWTSPESGLTVERIAATNHVVITLEGVAEMAVRAVPVTEEDDRIHRYGIPENDRYVHLEVQFKFFSLSEKVEGVLGRTYRPDYKNPAKPGVEMAVLGGENQYRTSSLLSPECNLCMFNPMLTDQ